MSCRAIAAAGGLEAALAAGLLPDARSRSALSEALVLGLLRQGVRKYLAIFGHGSTALAEALRVYEAHGLVRTWQFRNEIEMAHAATALRWIYGEAVRGRHLDRPRRPAGHGRLARRQPRTASASTTSMATRRRMAKATTCSRSPSREQGLYGQITALMGRSYVLHTPEALREALRQGAASRLPSRQGQARSTCCCRSTPSPARSSCASTPCPARPRCAAAGAGRRRHPRRGGRPDRRHEPRSSSRPAAARAPFAASAARASPRLPAPPWCCSAPARPACCPTPIRRTCMWAARKGSISGNFAMENAELLIVVGSRAVCQSDCSGIGYPQVQAGHQHQCRPRRRAALQRHAWPSRATSAPCSSG